MNLMSLAQLNPEHQMKMASLREKIMADASIARYSADRADELERGRAQNAIEIERYRAENSIGAERERGRNEIELEGVRSENRINEGEREFEQASKLQAESHQQKLLELHTDLQNAITLQSVDYQKSVLQGIDQMHRGMVDSLARSLEQQNAVMGDIMKQYAGAMFGEVAAQGNHERSLKEKTYAMLTDHIGKYLEAGLVSEAEREVDRVFAKCSALGL